MQRAEDTIRQTSFCLHNVDLARSWPDAIDRMLRHHPDRRPDSGPRRQLRADDQFAIAEGHVPLRIQLGRCISKLPVALVDSLATRTQMQTVLIYIKIVGAVRVELLLIVAPARRYEIAVVIDQVIAKPDVPLT
ncbi:hypothetical protein D3C84_926570 [compost metagenome]